MLRGLGRSNTPEAHSTVRSNLVFPQKHILFFIYEGGFAGKHPIQRVYASVFPQNAILYSIYIVILRQSYRGSWGFAGKQLSE